jgi:hypothetical protein
MENKASRAVEARMWKRHALRSFKVCNCADCGNLLLGESHRETRERMDESHMALLPPVVAGRLMGRPYCPVCLPLVEAVVKVQVKAG